ncbi:MAG TPA: protein kinase [Polyangia bacterium]|nr:protein kinase [Polyangia bacterium]
MEIHPQDAALVGTVLGEAYRLTRVLGRGGMGAVFEGQHLRLNKRVAVKMMTRELADNAEALARFRREAEVTSQLGHPHIVQVFDFGLSAAGEPYLVMEFLEGEDLDQRLRRVGRLPLAAATNIIKQVSSALAATHSKGIVHRDLKPANIFLLTVDETDFVKVVDFGISKVRAATTRLTAASVVMGTPYYMSPEQASGRVDEIDHRTDQWALACIAYELLAGRPPFTGENAASLLYQVVHQTPSPLTTRAPEVPGALDQVLGCALAKPIEQRFASMTVFARAFEDAVAGRPVAGLALAPVVSAPVAAAEPLADGGRSPMVTPKQTTFSTAAAEAIASEDGPPPRSNKPLVMGGVVATVLLAGAVLFATRGRPPVSNSAAAKPPAVSATPVAPAAASVAPPVPAPAPAVAPPAVTAAMDRPSKEKEKKEKPRKAKPRTERAATHAANGEPAAAVPAVSAQPASARGPAEVTPQPAWPPPGTAAEPKYQPAWPPPSDGTAEPPKPKKKGFFHRIFRRDD